MKKINFDDWKCRASEVGKLMTNPRKKTETLSQTTKTFLKEVFIREMFGRKKEIDNKYLRKGNQAEEDSITLYSDVTEILLFKNDKQFENDFFTGTPDNIQKKVRDFKTSWNIFTFPMFEIELKNKDYFGQLQIYMNLTGLKESELIYCLVDTPEDLIIDELRRESWKSGYLELPQEIEDEIRKNLTYSDIPKELRVKVFEVPYDEEYIAKAKERVIEARKYLQELYEKLTKVS